MLRIILILFLFVNPSRLFSQNLVLNPSFEETICFTNLCVQPIGCAKFWYNPTTSSPDYTNAYCASSHTAWCGPTLPDAFNEWAIAGAYMYAGGADSREYIGGKLSMQLTAGQKYSVSFYARICSYSIYPVRDIGLYVGDSLTTTGAGFFTYSPQISNPNNRPLNDSTIWYKIEGDFIADGGENYITIGNFKNDTNTTFDTILTGSTVGSYYYFDNVSLTRFIDTTIMEFSFYPNPNNGNFTLNYNLGENEDGFVDIYNSIGQIVHRKKLFQNNGIVNFELNLSSGCYYLQLISGDAVLRNEKLIIVR